MKIQSLLNPFIARDDRNGYVASESPVPAPIPYSVAPYTSLPKRQKIPKDAPIFSEGTKVVGYVNYPPHEGSEDENLAAQHRRFKLFPMGEIHKKGVRHVPYNSDKKDFLNKTGRESFELFQYTYRVGTDDKEYVVLWDYNVGLVRMTPFFKSLKYSKTIPAKALRENPGLKDISYSITGGALVCQGYWMPYQAAKAIAATFCWHIRWVLTPVFGYDFPDMCVHPNDPRYSKFVIDPKIVQECINETNRFREEGAAYKVAGHLESAKADTPQLPILNSPWNPMPDHPRKSVESGYYTGGDQNERPSASPQESPMGSTWVTPWTSVNGPKSTSTSPVIHSPTFDRVTNQLPPLDQQLREHGVHFEARPTSVPEGYYNDLAFTKRTHSEIARDNRSWWESNGCTSTVRSPQSTNDTEANRHGDRTVVKKDLEAAEILSQLSAADHGLPAPKRTCRGSRY